MPLLCVCAPLDPHTQRTTDDAWPNNPRRGSNDTQVLIVSAEHPERCISFLSYLRSLEVLSGFTRSEREKGLHVYE
jgi:hypothetical protein